MVLMLGALNFGCEKSRIILMDDMNLKEKRTEKKILRFNWLIVWFSCWAGMDSSRRIIKALDQFQTEINKVPLFYEMNHW